MKAMATPKSLEKTRWTSQSSADPAETRPLTALRERHTELTRRTRSGGHNSTACNKSTNVTKQVKQAIYFFDLRRVSSLISVCCSHRLIRDESFRIDWIFV
ncbi:hypothetical protein DPMN_147097 [Dreissena polymorpha]|uniref:Uncharacterized protein n=1 Tax=Dreissena polymorpha TaxID=45954 RepID=A0A9D4F7R4_DREPO|nr:hypothetical protein DPMN_147097 [Dreissena polymorpha]